MEKIKVRDIVSCNNILYYRNEYGQVIFIVGLN